jgi:hypothetical protein
MSHPGFGHLWQQAELSDVEIVILCASDTVPEGDEAPEAEGSCSTLLRQFPGHSPILSLSPYFVAQVSQTAVVCVSHYEQDVRLHIKGMFLL